MLVEVSMKDKKKAERRYQEYLMLTSQDFPTQRHHKLFDSVEFLLLLAF